MHIAEIAILIVKIYDMIKEKGGIRMNLLRSKLEKGEKIHGTLVSTTDPCMCEIMGNIGYDCVWIDMEHTHMSYKDVLCHLNAARATGIAAIVRLPQNDLTATKKVLEMGPDGVIFPMVKSAQELKELMDMTLYPPHGNRGFGPLRGIGYGAIDAGHYARKLSFEMLRFVQIEHVDLIADMEQVLQVPYVDGFIFGPNDLSGSLGDFLNVFGEATMQKIEQTVAVLKENKRIVGLAGGLTETELKNWSAFAPDMLFAGADWSFIYSCGKDTLQKMKTLL